MQGCTKTQDDVARVMSRLRLINGVQRVTLASSIKQDSGANRSCGNERGIRERVWRGTRLRGERAELRSRRLLRAAAGRRRGRRHRRGSHLSRAGRDRRRHDGGLRHTTPAATTTPATSTPATTTPATTTPASAATSPRLAAGQQPRSRTGEHEMTARDRKVLVVVCVLAAIGAAWFFVIQPKRSEASKLGAQITSAQSQLDAARAQVAAGQAAQSSFASNYTTLARLGEAVPSDDNVPSLIYQVQSAAAAARVDFRNLTLSSRRCVGAPGRLPIGAPVRDGRIAARRYGRTGRVPGRAVHVHLPRELLPSVGLPRSARALRRRPQHSRLGKRSADVAECDQPRRRPDVDSPRSPPRSPPRRTSCRRLRACWPELPTAGPATAPASRPVSGSTTNVPAAPATIATPVK